MRMTTSTRAEMEMVKFALRVSEFVESPSEMIAAVTLMPPGERTTTGPMRSDATMDAAETRTQPSDPALTWFASRTEPTSGLDDVLSSITTEIANSDGSISRYGPTERAMSKR